MEELKAIEARKQEIQELKEVCKPVSEFLKKKHPIAVLQLTVIISS